MFLATIFHAKSFLDICKAFSSLLTILYSLFCFFNMKGVEIWTTSTFWIPSTWPYITKTFTLICIITTPSLFMRIFTHITYSITEYFHSLTSHMHEWHITHSRHVVMHLAALACSYCIVTVGFRHGLQARASMVKSFPVFILMLIVNTVCRIMNFLTK